MFLKMRPSYLGKILVHWCDSCHVPVLAATCGCGASARKVGLTPPRDARPVDEVRAQYPDLWNTWRCRLSGWREAQGLPPEWVLNEQWRIREG